MELLLSFASCYNLTSVTMGEGVTSIGGYAFEYCYSLMSITIPKSVTSIHYSAFSCCYSLVEVINKSSLDIDKRYDELGYCALEVNDGSTKIKKQDSFLFYTVDGVNYLVGYTGNQTELVLPDKYNNQNYKINKYAFYNSNIKSIVIGSGVVEIDKYAFSGCSSLTSVEFKNTNGWTVGGTSAGANVLSIKETAAAYLKNTYVDKVWTRS